MNLGQNSVDEAVSPNRSHSLVAVVIPAFNEEQSIAAVVSNVRDWVVPIVIDDGSFDGTAEKARLAGAIVVKHSSNKGYDGALETGLRTAIDYGFKFAITMDADGQHDPTLLQSFNAELEAGADLVVGIRDKTQRWSEMVFCFFGRILWGISDPLCGMKGYRLQALVNLKNLNTYQSIGTEAALKLAKAQMKISQVKVYTRPRYGISRFGHGFKVNMQIMKALIFGCFLRAD